MTQKPLPDTEYFYKGILVLRVKVNISYRSERIVRYRNRADIICQDG